MLAPERVHQLLDGDDPELRWRAADYFASGYTPYQLSQADIFQAQDRWGRDASATVLLQRFSELSPWDDSARRLKELGSESELLPGVVHAIAALDARATDEWLTAPGIWNLHRDVRDLLRIRRQIRGRSTRELWRMHQVLFDEVSPNAYRLHRPPRFEAVRAELRERGTDACELALFTLEEASASWDDWDEWQKDGPSSGEDAALSWLAENPYPDALPLLVEARLGWLPRASDLLEQALVRCGEEALAHMSADRALPSCPFFIGNFHVPEVEDFLTTCFLNAPDPDRRCDFGIALCLMFSTNALPHILDAVVRGDCARDEVFDDMLVAAGRAADWAPPELRAIRESRALPPLAT